MLHKISIIILSILGELIKMYYRIVPIRRVDRQIERINNKKVICSLTSYGRRVTSVLPFALISLIRQTYKPDKIIVWLDNENWNYEKIPLILRNLEKFGVEYKFCEDIKSYKKLIPTLQLYPNDIIITYDDDLFYPKRSVERLVREYQKDSAKIYTHLAHKPLFDTNGELLPYMQWQDLIEDSDDSPIFPTGGAGCLYTSNLLYKDITEKELFMSLSPKADDVWFYFMGVLRGTKAKVLKKDLFLYIPLDNFYQLTHSNSRLSESNCGLGQNDIQINNIMEYYKLKSSDLILNS